MAVQVSKSGGIYIEISGDYTKLQADLKEAGVIGKAMGKEISDALSGALTPRNAASASANLNKYFSTASRAAQATKADLSGMDADFRKMGQAIGVAEKSLDGYVKMQRQMYQAQSQKAFMDNLKGIQRLTGQTDDEMNKLAKSLGGVGNEFSKASEGIKIFGVGLGTALMAGAGAFIGKKLFDFGKESFDLAARYETLGVVVQQVGKVAGYSAVEVDKNVSALRRMGIAGVEARKTLTQIMQAQVGIGKAPGLARVAQDAAVIGGTNSSDAFEKMVHGIQSAQTEVLRTIGINVNFEQSYAKMAASLGKTTSELTEQEKVQARVNAVMEAGEKISGSYEAAMTTLGKQMSSLTRVQQDFATDFGKFSLEVAKSSGGVNGYTTVLEGWNAIILAIRGKMAGLSFDEMTRAGREGHLQGMRDITEGTEAAINELERFDIQATALAAKGFNVEPFVKDVARAKEEFFGVREEITRLESMISLFEQDGLDTSGMITQLEALKKKLIEGARGADLLRLSIQEASVWMRGIANAPATNAPASMFVFKPYKAGSGVDPDIREIDKTLTDLRASYNKTSDGAKLAKQGTIKENQQLVNALVAQGHMAKDEAGKLNQAFSKELDTLTKGSRTASLAAERTSYQAAESARAAADSLKNLQLRYSELVAQIDGNSLGAALARSQRDYETQLDAIAKKEAEIAKNRALWAKEGKLTGETRTSLDEQQKYLDQEKEILRLIKDANDKLANRADLERTASANMNYAQLVGDLRAYSAEEVKLLALQMERASAAEKIALAERQRIAQARADLDIGGMFETGMANMAKDAQQRVIDFWEKTLPESIGSATDTIGVAFAQIGLGTKSISQSFAEMGKTIQGIFQQIISDFINMSIRMAMFGQNGSGGLLGGLVSGIGGMFTGGVPQPGSPNFVGPMPQANGGVFSAPALSAYSNSIVAKPTLFPFAKGIGLMGEAGAEAIMPLRRGSGGRLGIDASGLGAQAPQVNVIVNTPPGVGVAEKEQRPNGQGGFDMTILLEMVDKAMASGISSGRSKTAHAMSMRGI